MKDMSWPFLRFCISFFAVFLAGGHLKGGDLKVGERFPNIALPSLNDGSRLSISDFRGGKLILHIWASW
jgi:hypothetical protein